MVHYIHMYFLITTSMCLFLGNMFGETGIEIIKETMESKGQLDILGSLSDDEGEEDEDENENEDEDEGSEPEETDQTSLITNGHSLEVCPS